MRRTSLSWVGVSSLRRRGRRRMERKSLSLTLRSRVLPVETTEALVGTEGVTVVVIAVGLEEAGMEGVTDDVTVEAEAVDVEAEEEAGDWMLPTLPLFHH
jgi:hypothetical protein